MFPPNKGSMRKPRGAVWVLPGMNKGHYQDLPIQVGRAETHVNF